MGVQAYVCTGDIIKKKKEFTNVSDGQDMPDHSWHAHLQPTQSARERERERKRELVSEDVSFGCAGT
jgi:hypothetical protein